MATSGQDQVDVRLAPRPAQEWTEEDVAHFFKEMDIRDSVIETFKEKKVDGKRLLQSQWTKAELSHWKSEEDQQQLDRVLTVIGRLQGLQQRRAKVFQDPIHGAIELHPLLVRIVDTPEFQRLRDIKQLGGVYFVYPGASHNRFEHSLGVCHLAGMLVESLKSRQPELGITPQEVLCVQIAGLCHDMGHGPFSHLFQDLFIPHVKPTKEMTHEQLSVRLFRHMLDRHPRIQRYFRKYGFSKQDIDFIEELMRGIDKGQEIKGRPKKVYLYEIVANKLNGIDVDKMDYIARDSRGLGLHFNFDWRRYFMFARVIKADEDGCLHICAREKEVLDLYDLFRARDNLHRKAYQHKTKRAIEQMIKHALGKADAFIRLPAEKGRATVKMSEAVDDMYAFTHLTDSVLQIIKLYPEEALYLLVKDIDDVEEREEMIEELKKARQKAQQLVENIEKRNLYECIGSTVPRDDGPKCPTSQIRDQIVAQVISEEDSPVKITKQHILVEEVWFRSGLGSSCDLVENIFFYSKWNFNKAVKIKKEQVSKAVSAVFEEVEYRVYLTKTSHKDGKYDDRLLTLKRKFKAWCTANGYQVPPGESQEAEDYPDGRQPDASSSNGSGSGLSTPPEDQVEDSAYTVVV